MHQHSNWPTSVGLISGYRDPMGFKLPGFSEVCDMHLLYVYSNNDGK